MVVLPPQHVPQVCNVGFYHHAAVALTWRERIVVGFWPGQPPPACQPVMIIAASMTCLVGMGQNSREIPEHWA